MGLEKEITVTLKVKGKDPFVLRSKIKGLETLSKLESDEFDKLVLLSKSTEAKNYLKNNWDFLKGMLGINQ